MTAPTTRRPTILDVASAAGVSKSLVSLALRGDPGVSDATRERILLAADALGYRLNALARGLVQGRTSIFGVVSTDLSNPYHSEVVTGIEEAAEQAGFAVLIGHARRDRDRLVRRIDSMLELAVDGVIVVSSWADERTLQHAAARVPVVVVGRMPNQVRGIDSIVGDDAAGVAAAVAHLHEEGHQRIAFGSTSSRPAAEARRSGFHQAMRARGLAASAVEARGATAEELAAAVLALDIAPTAVIANNDVAAVRIIDAALDRGRRVPDDLAVVGYDNTALATLVRPALTSVDQPNDAIARTAVAFVTERLDGRIDDRHEVLAPTLVVRASSAGRASIPTSGGVKP